jgi:homoserine kinase
VGVALDLWNELEVTDGEGVVVEGEGAGELPADESNLVVRAYALRASPHGKRFRLLNRIPLERGLGSSAAVIVLGLIAAMVVQGRKTTYEELLAEGIELEGHGDNLAAALAGGACLTWQGKVVRVAEQAPAVPIALIPESTTSTRTARDRLPAEVTHDDAVFSATRAALLGAALASGSEVLFAAALEDRLHEPYRQASAPLLEEVRNQLPEGALGATLSGSGPTVIVWARYYATAACAKELSSRYPDVRVLALQVSPRGAHAL